MTGHAISPELLAGMVLAGLCFGLLYFLAMQQTVTLLTRRRAWRAGMALTFARMGAAAAFLALAGRVGAVPLLAAFAGFLLARGVALRIAGRMS